MLSVQCGKVLQLASHHAGTQVRRYVPTGAACIPTAGIQQCSTNTTRGAGAKGQGRSSTCSGAALRAFGASMSPLCRSQHVLLPSIVVQKGALIHGPKPQNPKSQNLVLQLDLINRRSICCAAEGLNRSALHSTAVAYARFSF